MNVPSMNAPVQEQTGSLLAVVVAPEDVRRGDFVAVLSETIEVPSFFWNDTLPCARGELVRVRRVPTEDRAPLKVKAVCLPFVFVKQWNGQYQTLDVRLVRLVRLERPYAKTVWKSLKAPAPAAAAPCSGG